MTTFPGLPKLLTDGIVLVDPNDLCSALAHRAREC